MRIARNPWYQRFVDSYATWRDNRQTNIDNALTEIRPRSQPINHFQESDVSPGYSLNRGIKMLTVALALGAVGAAFGYRGCHSMPSNTQSTHTLNKHETVSTYAIDRDIIIASGETVWEVTRDNYNLTTDAATVREIAAVSDYNIGMSDPHSPLERAALSDTKAVDENGNTINQSDGIRFDDIPAGMRITLPKVDTIRVTTITYKDENTDKIYDENLRPIMGQINIPSPQGAELVKRTTSITDSIMVPVNNLVDSTNTIKGVVTDAENTSPNNKDLTTHLDAGASAIIIASQISGNKYSGIKKESLYSTEALNDITQLYATSDAKLRDIAEHIRATYHIEMSTATISKHARAEINRYDQHQFKTRREIQKKYLAQGSLDAIVAIVAKTYDLAA